MICRSDQSSCINHRLQQDATATKVLYRRIVTGEPTERMSDTSSTSCGESRIAAGATAVGLRTGRPVRLVIEIVAPAAVRLVPQHQDVVHRRRRVRALTTPDSCVAGCTSFLFELPLALAHVRAVDGMVIGNRPA